MRNDLSGLFLLRARPPAIAWIDVVPVAIGRCQVNRARGAERDWFVERFTALCAELGTEVLAAGEALTVPVGAAPGQGAEATGMMLSIVVGSSNSMSLLPPALALAPIDYRFW